MSSVTALMRARTSLAQALPSRRVRARKRASRGAVSSAMISCTMMLLAYIWRSASIAPNSTSLAWRFWRMTTNSDGFMVCAVITIDRLLASLPVPATSPTASNTPAAASVSSSVPRPWTQSLQPVLSGSASTITVSIPWRLSCRLIALPKRP